MNQPPEPVVSETVAERYGVTVFGMPLSLFAITAIAILGAHYLDILPGGVVGGFALMFVLGAFFGEIGQRLPFWNRYIGGGPVLVFLASASLVYAGILTQREIDIVSGVMKDTRFIDLFIAVLICGSILPVNRKLLLHSLLGYIPSILVAIAGAMLFGCATGFVLGIPMNDIVMLYVLPIMGGGNGAGAIPLSEIYEAVTGKSKENYYSVAISILTIANVIAIICASLLDTLGKRYPVLTGNGELVRRGLMVKTEDDQCHRKVSGRDLAVGLLLATALYVLAQVFSTGLAPLMGTVRIHPYAWMVLLVALMNAMNLVPYELKEGARRMAAFFSEELLWLLMVGVGIVYTDLTDLLAAISFSNVLAAGMVVIGAIIGAAVGGWLFGFYMIESAITAGLCMANRGGSGDLEVLAASNRMILMPYAQLSSRLGGGMVLVIGSLIFGVLG